MKFVIEAVGLTVAGGKELALDLMASLAGHKEHQFTFIVPDLVPYNSISGGNIRTTVCARGSGLLRRARLLNHAVPRICRNEKADALLCLGNFPPRKPGCPTAVLLQNAWMVYRDPAAESRRRLREEMVTAYGRHTYRNLHNGVTIITQTPIMKDHLCGRYGIDPDRVAIIPNTFSVKPRGDGFRAPSVSNQGARPSTFLCLAHYYAHKNIDVLMDAVGKLPKYTGRSAKCLITIAPDQHPGARLLLERLDRGEAAGKIENIGPVPSEMLPEVYRRADALVFPTLLESFSRTYLEAMYFGLPILTSDRDFAHHLCGDAAIYFDPLDADSVARSMASVMEDGDLRQRLVTNGRRLLAQAPTWDEIAARFVEVLERTARGEKGPWAKRRGQVPPSADVRTLFNREARGWRSKYHPNGKLHSRVEQFTARLARLCPAPARILDLGCGTGEIAAAISQRGYPVTACDFAEEMMAVARSNYARTPVNWVGLDPEWKALPFADASFDAIVASSVFEYLDDVQRVATELSRVLRPEGVLLLTVPNPCNLVRKLEARLQSMRLVRPLSSALGRVQRIDSYAAYLRLSRNRFEAPAWQSVLAAGHFAPLDERDFSEEAWRKQARAPLVLLAVKKVATPGSGQLDAEEALCRSVTI